MGLVPLHLFFYQVAIGLGSQEREKVMPAGLFRSPITGIRSQKYQVHVGSQEVLSIREALVSTEPAGRIVLASASALQCLASLQCPGNL